ncbi:MAG: hypothetical protein RL367_1552 [Pseudomonadota bacterium]|jgi:hypothetical protein
MTGSRSEYLIATAQLAIARIALSVKPKGGSAGWFGAVAEIEAG